MEQSFAEGLTILQFIEHRGKGVGWGSTNTATHIIAPFC